MAPPSWAFYLESFCTPPDDELVCSFCRNVFCNPIQTPCKHVFCESCIKMWLQKSRDCPMCRVHVTTNKLQDVVPLIKNLIANLKIRCCNSEKGCKDTFSLEKAEQHMKNCLYETVKCKNEPCVFMALKTNIETHETNECHFRRIVCDRCNLSLTQDKVVHNCVDELKRALQEEKKKSKEFQEELQKYKNRYGSVTPAGSGVKERGSKKRVKHEKDQCGSRKSASRGSSSFNDFFSPTTSKAWPQWNFKPPPIPPQLYSPADVMSQYMNHQGVSNEPYNHGPPYYQDYSVTPPSQINNLNESNSFTQAMNSAGSTNNFGCFNSFFENKLNQPSNPASNTNHSTVVNSKQSDNKGQQLSTAGYSYHSTQITNSNPPCSSSQKSTTVSYSNQFHNLSQPSSANYTDQSSQITNSNQLISLNQQSTTASYPDNTASTTNSNQSSCSNQKSTTGSDPNHSTFITDSNQPSDQKPQSTTASYLNNSSHINSNEPDNSTHTNSDTVENNSATVPLVVDLSESPDEPMDFIDLTIL